ncbi:hypothetical protein ARALYDRAFT_487940, partial [Arabidopsis lyrata subsp. lyrata]
FKILHYTTQNLSVERTIHVIELKQEISYYCGVSPERQHRLLFRGRLLKNDQSLSDYQKRHSVSVMHVYIFPKIPLIGHSAGDSIFYHNLISTSESFKTSVCYLWQAPSRSREDLIARVGTYDKAINISMLLVDEVNVTDPSARRLRQERVVESGSLLCNLGSSLLAPPQELAWEKHSVHIPNRAKSVTGLFFFTSLLAANKYRSRKEHKSYIFHVGDHRGINNISISISMHLKIYDECVCEELSDSDSEHEMVNTKHTKKEMVGVSASETLFLDVDDAER